MKSQISSVDLHYLMKEFQVLIDSRIDKIYQHTKGELLFSFFVSGKGKYMLRIISGKFIFLTDQKGRSSEPTGFCMFLRKYLNNARVRSISQMGSERVVRMEFSTKEKNYHLYIELFGKGNVVLCSPDDIIINAEQQQKWADREIKKGNAYVYPKKDVDFSLSLSEFSASLGSELVLDLAKNIGIGGNYAEEICSLAGIDKKKKTVSESETKKLYASYKKVIEHPLAAGIVLSKGKIKEIFPYLLSGYTFDKEFSTFSSAYDYFYTEEYAKQEKFISKHQQAIDKTSAIIAAQQKQIRKLEKQSTDYNRKGELLYEQYQEVNAILTDINDARKKLSFEEISAKLKGHKVVKKVDGKSKSVVVSID